MAVVTGSTQGNAYPRIAKNYAEYIHQDHIITAESVQNGKPHPDPYLMGMELFGVKPENTIVIENAPLGVKSGHDAVSYTHLADYCYVVSAPGKVDLYKAKERLKRNIPQEEAVRALIELILSLIHI